MVSDMVCGYGCANGVESDHVIEERHVVTGAVPSDLFGTWYHNGPGQMERGGVSLSQPFDGDGFVTALSLRDGRAHFRSRFVATAQREEEERRGRFLYRGAFSAGNPAGGVLFNPFDLDVKNVSNTGLLAWRGEGGAPELLSLHEAGLPHRLCARTLRTLGETDLGGGIEGGVLAAHYRITADRVTNFGAEVVGGRDSRVVFYEWERPDLKGAAAALGPPELLSKTVYTIDNGAFGFYHDHAVTQSSYILYENPTRLDLRRFFTQYALGRASIAECIQYDGESRSLRLHLLPRPRPGLRSAEAARRSFDIGPGFVFHIINAWDLERSVSMPQGGAVVDAVIWRQIDFGRTAQLDRVEASDYVDGDRPMAERVTVDFASGEVHRRVLTDRAVEFGDVREEGAPHRYAYLAAGCHGHPNEWGPAMAVMKLEAGGIGPRAADASATVRALGKRRLVNEPLFVPREGACEGAEDDGYVLCQVYDAESHGTPRLIILDAETLDIVCEIALDDHVPFRLHGTFVPGVILADGAGCDVV